ncbi:Adenosylcobinamide kinase [Hartmannibacter diazotrophicus]|uniref:Bifunctional adenosylcobalamin biosynthesis protein n=1 Tax=Hartmannibacter diazotrophicus TaxID=1482074 RepID=A0A2C9DAD8_9HYPH|nr:bifunctional adenosylcobinamide kinase/adenosylcobinamide-phosphate guanylyltransferase [Hartmannibacter diazotrophicus]SON56565.1 Adenosylcobinamide kinase [Hartmannibacter diazotrophicus]
MSEEARAGVTLVLGGARSGKTAFGERLTLGMAEGLGHGRGVFLATAEAHDEEMALRIRQHQADRADRFVTIEEPLALADAIRARSGDGVPILVDCLTLWVTNLLLAGQSVGDHSDRLVAALADCASPVVLIANETGLGIVPDNALARAFRDEAGRLNQKVAALADRVYFVVAGLPMQVK